MQIRLDKLLASQGKQSRSEVKIYLKQGKVTVDGLVEKNCKTKVDTNKNIVELDGNTISYTKYRYIMLNKPTGVVSATEDYLNETVIDILKDEQKYKGLFPVGRLDIDTVGLIILTNDGTFAHNTLSPKRHVYKVYRARIFGKVTDEDITDFYNGIQIDTGYICKSALLTVLSSNVYSDIEVRIKEGKFHQIKKMFEAVGKKVVYLQRIEFCGIKLDNNLMEGEARELNKEEMNIINNYISRN